MNNKRFLLYHFIILLVFGLFFLSLPTVVKDFVVTNVEKARIFMRECFIPVTDERLVMNSWKKVVTAYDEYGPFQSEFIEKQKEFLLRYSHSYKSKSCQKEHQLFRDEYFKKYCLWKDRLNALKKEFEAIDKNELDDNVKNLLEVGLEQVSSLTKTVQSAINMISSNFKSMEDPLPENEKIIRDELQSVQKELIVQLEK